MKHVDSAGLSADVYRMALERIEALSGCTEESEEEQELIHWAEIAAAYERTVSTPP
jgi:hypothetical protein